VKGEISITTEIGCDNDCWYCPQDKLKAAYKSKEKSMKFEMFKKYLSKIPKTTLISFSGFGEPFQNKDCLKMIEHTFKKGYEVSLFTKGTHVTHEGFLHLEKYPFKKFVSENNIPKWMMHTRAGNLENKGVEKISFIKGKLKPCNKIRTGILLPNGDVALCAHDFGLKHIIGNLKTQTLNEVFKSKEYKRVLAGYSDEKEDILCRNCEEMLPITNQLKRRYHSLEEFKQPKKMFKFLWICGEKFNKGFKRKID
jgi:radical SAM protein with 4Fe4S-binding SPASM domain